VDIGKNIRERREQIGLTQAELAERIDVSRGLIARIERNDSVPSLCVLFGISEQLGCEAAELLAEEGR
jgi:transcriptional regulator with XRE-family HTH domain